MSETEVEQAIQKKGSTAPRITPDHIDSIIANTAYHKMTDVLTICIIQLQNGFTVIGESACASPENFDVEIGRKIAFEDAKAKIWPLEGYLLKEQLYLSSKPIVEYNNFDDDIPF